MNKLRSFRYGNVRLNDSHWKKQQTDLLETYLAIDNGEYLHYFRKLAGISDDSNGLVGWYGNNASTFGQKLAAFVKLYLVTCDARAREKAIALADGWGECAKASSAVIDVNDTYVYDKLMGGFVDLYEYLHYEPAKEYMRWITESAKKRFKKGIDRDGLQVMGPDMIEWYTLPENLFRAYELTNEEMYKEFALEWDYTYFWNKLLKHDFKIGPRHAYSHVNALSSGAMAYIVTGDTKYLEAIEIAYEEILKNYTFATGGYGPAECLFPDEEGFLGYSIKANWDEGKPYETYRNFGASIRARDDKWGSCEVSCCAWAVFKICNYLLMLTGEAKYGDWAEKMLINGCGGQLPITSDGKVMYYADYFINGGFKSVEDGRMHSNGCSFEWQCCTGTFPQDVAEYSNMLYYRGENDIYVSQYLASRLDRNVDGVGVSLENTSFYPKEKILRFVFRSSEPITHGLHFRVPSWAVGKNEVKVNGEKIECDAKPNTWIDLTRVWKDGDVITIDFEFILRFEAVDEFSKNVAALCYGPVVLVCNKMTIFEGGMSNPTDWIEPIQKDGYSFAFKTKPGHVAPYEHLTREFYPYYEVPEMEWYYMYNQIR